MYIYKIIINNFRCIKHIEWKPNEHVNILIGGNGSGKSTIAIALNYLLNPYISWYRNTLSEVDFYDRNTNENISIEVWFKGVEEFVIDDADLLFEHIDTNDNISNEGKELILITKMTCDQSMKPKHIIISNGSEVQLTQSIKQAINFKFIEAERDPLKELAFYNNSILSKLLQNENTSELIEKIIKELDKSAEKNLFSDDKFKQSFDTLRKSFKEFGLITSDEDSLKLEITDLSERKTLQAFSLASKNENITKPIPLKYQSRGIKNLMLLVALQDQMEDNNILFIEEIEQNLEAQLQRKIIKSIKKKIKGQLFLTTHSPEIVKLFDFDNISLVKRGQVYPAPTMKKDNRFEILIEKQAKYELISGLFSKGVLLVEGQSEKGGIPTFSEIVDYDIQDYGISLIFCDGKDNVCKYAKFYNEAHIPTVSLFDNDKDIKKQFDKLKTNNNPILVVPDDYEGSLITSNVFQKEYKQIFDSYMPFNEGNRDKYVNPFKFDKYRNQQNNLLREFYNSNQSLIDNATCLSDIVDKLQGEILIQYQKNILHTYFANIPSAKFIACSIVDEIDNEEEQDVIPIVFQQIFKLTDNYITNKCICKENKVCVINCINNTDIKTEDICMDCGNFMDGYTNVIQVRGE